jgi:hypothetical protein
MLILTDSLKTIQVFKISLNAAYFQLQAFNDQHKIKEKLRNKILLEIDFKQKIVIGLSPRQVNEEYYKQVQRICLGKI